MHGRKGPVATLAATPRAGVGQTLPTAPRGLRAEGSLYERGASQLGQVKLSWEAPVDLGNAYLVRYEYRYAARGGSVSSAAWLHGGDAPVATGGRVVRTMTERNLARGTSYLFEVRAVTLAGAGAVARVGATTPARGTTPGSSRPRLSVFTRGSAVEGESLTIGVRRSGMPDPDAAVLAVVDIYDSAGSRRSAKAVDIAVGSREGTVEFAVPFDGARGAARELEVTLGPGTWIPARAYWVGTPARATVRVRNMDPLVSVRDARVREGAGGAVELRGHARPRGAGDGDGGLRDVGRDGDGGVGLHGEVGDGDDCGGRAARGHRGGGARRCRRRGVGDGTQLAGQLRHDVLRALGPCRRARQHRAHPVEGDCVEPRARPVCHQRWVGATPFSTSRSEAQRSA